MAGPSFTVVERPKQSGPREKEPNPYADAVADLAKNGKPDSAVAFKLDNVTKPKTVTKTVDGKEKESTKLDPQINKAFRQLREAGDAQTPPVSVRTSVAYGAKAKDTATVTFWTTKKIARPRKNAENGAEAATPDASAS